MTWRNADVVLAPYKTVVFIDNTLQVLANFKLLLHIYIANCFFLALSSLHATVYDETQPNPTRLNNISSATRFRFLRKVLHTDFIQKHSLANTPRLVGVLKVCNGNVNRYYR